MIGRATAGLWAPPRRWIERFWGVPDINMRQKWRAVWPHLTRLPARGVRLLDAGCGEGRWSLELACRRPEWSVVGIDQDAAAIGVAAAAGVRLALKNASFVGSHFLRFDPQLKFDAVLSVHSAHYLAEQGRGFELFRAFRCWLRPGGWLVLLGPRRVEEAAFTHGLPRPAWHSVFGGEELAALCEQNQLVVERLSGCIGRLGTVAKQLDWGARAWARPLRAGLYPLLAALSALDGGRSRSRHDPTLMWLLVARANG